MAVDDEWLGPGSRRPRGESRSSSTSNGTSLGVPGPGDVVAEKYRIERLIGEGGMGTVFEATHLVMESPVAVKWLCADFGEFEETRARFLREAKAAARIRHPNVVQVFDVGEQEGGLFMVMELLEGQPLSALIARDDVTIATLLQLLVQAMWGVGAAHERGIVHRDIKPDNIFVVEDRTQPSGLRAKVLDFGISKFADEGPATSDLTKSGVSMGTPAYMSLEQMNGARDVDARADIYGFGVLMYRALTRQLPFEGKTFAALSVAIATHSPPTPKQLRPELSQALSSTVMRAMAREREDRYASLQELLETLASIGALEGHAEHPSRPPYGPSGVTATSSEDLTLPGPAPAADPALSCRTPVGAARARRAGATPPSSGRWRPWALATIALLAAAAVVGWFSSSSQAPTTPQTLPATQAAKFPVEPLRAGPLTPDREAPDEGTTAGGHGSDPNHESRPMPPRSPKAEARPPQEVPASAPNAEAPDAQSADPAIPTGLAAGRKAGARAVAQQRKTRAPEQAEARDAKRSQKPLETAPTESSADSLDEAEPEAPAASASPPVLKRVEHRSGGVSPGEW